MSDAGAARVVGDGAGGVAEAATVAARSPPSTAVAQRAHGDGEQRASRKARRSLAVSASSNAVPRGTASGTGDVPSSLSSTAPVSASAGDAKVRGRVRRPFKSTPVRSKVAATRDTSSVSSSQQLPLPAEQSSGSQGAALRKPQRRRAGRAGVATAAAHTAPSLPMAASSRSPNVTQSMHAAQSVTRDLSDSPQQQTQTSDGGGDMSAHSPPAERGAAEAAAAAPNAASQRVRSLRKALRASPVTVEREFADEHNPGYQLFCVCNLFAWSF